MTIECVHRADDESEKRRENKYKTDLYITPMYTAAGNREEIVILMANQC